MTYSPVVRESLEAASSGRDPNVGSFANKDSKSVGTGLVGAPACGDVMKLQVEIGKDMRIRDAKYKTFGCGSAISASAYICRTIKGMKVDEALKIKNSDVAKELVLPPVKLHCSLLAEEALHDALRDWKLKNEVDT